MRILSLFIYFVFIAGVISAQSKFYKLYSSNGFDIGKGVAEYSDSSFIVCGSSTSWGGSAQLVLLKVDSTGSYEWSNEYGGAESDGANRVLYNQSVGVYAIGYTNSIGNGDYNGLVLRTDEYGGEIWQKSFGVNSSWEFFNDAVFGNDTTIFMVGYSQNVSNGNKNIYMVRIDADGNELFSQTFPEYEAAEARSITNVQDSLFVIGGSYYSSDSLVNKGFLMKVNMSGDVLWFKSLGNLSGEYAVNDVSLGNNKVYVVGSRKLSEDNHDHYSAVLDFDGNVIIEKTEVDVNEVRNHIGDEICYISNVNMPIAGERKINQFTFQDDYDVYFSYYTPNSLVWMNNFSTINNAGLDRTGQILETSDGGFVAVGQTTFPMSGGSNMFIFKSGPDGTFPLTADYYIIDTLVDVPEIVVNEVRVFPNPSSGMFLFSSSNQLPKSIAVYDALGKVIFDRVLFNNGVIDLSSFRDGFYYARIEDVLVKLVKVSN